MEIKPSEVEHVENIGQIDGNPVRILKTVGGFWMAVGRPKGKKKDEALAAGSHPAVVKYNVEKNHSDFQPLLAKSEALQSDVRVTGFTELLPKCLRQKGYDMIMLEKNEDTTFVLTKYGYEANSYEAKLSDESIDLSKAKKPVAPELVGFSRAVAEAAAIKALNEGKAFVDHDGTRFDAAKIMARR